MNLSGNFIALLAAAQTVVGFPFGGSPAAEPFAPVAVLKLTCDGNTYQCTGTLDWGDGNWVAQWSTAVFHTGLFSAPDYKETVHKIAMAPVPVTQLNCDGNTYKCTANLDFGDGGWVAQWSTAVFHQITGVEQALAPVPVTKLVCDGNTYQCTANLQWGDGNWVAQWGTAVFHTSTAKATRRTFKCQVGPAIVTDYQCVYSCQYVR